MRPDERAQQIACILHGTRQWGAGDPPEARCLSCGQYLCDVCGNTNLNMCHICDEHYRRMYDDEVEWTRFLWPTIT